MFLGHYGVALAAKTVSKRASLGTLLLAACFLDLLWPTFLLTGLESVSIRDGATAFMPLVFEHYPWSHSLAATLGWAALLGSVYFILRGNTRTAWVVGLLVLSHWLLDAIVHVPDLEVVPGVNLVIGAGLWNHPGWTLALELPLFLLGLNAYTKATRANSAPGGWGLWAWASVLVLIYLASAFGPPPPDATAIAIAGQLQWLLVGWGYWLDRHRRTILLF